MGRSKFPGKPSKSIHRKRISVLQLDTEDETHGTETPTEELQQQQQQGEQDARTQNKSNNCDDDDDDDDNAPSAGGSGAGGGGGGGGNASGAQATSTKGNGNANAGEANGSNVNGANDGGGRQNKSSNPSENVEQIVIAKNRQSIDSNEHNNSNSNSNDAAQEKDDVDEFGAGNGGSGDGGGGDGEEDDDDEEDGNEAVDKTTIISGRQIGCIAASTLRLARRSSNKKFKNLNLARAEVMLPSTSKLKLQQQQLQLNCPSTSSPMSPTTATENATDTATTTMSTLTTTPIVAGAIAATTTTAGTSCVNPFAATESSKAEEEDALNNVALHKKSNDMASEAGGTGATNLPIETKSPTSPKCAASIVNAAPTSSTPTATAAKQKKTVTFKNILETSDDKSAVKRFYNPDNRIPLVSIMKKECMNRPLAYSRNSECIVRPSILSKILNKNSNIDKLNSLKFRTTPAASTTSASAAAAAAAANTGSKNVFGSALSRVFGALADNEEDEQGGVTFRLSKKETDETNNKTVHDADEDQSTDDDGENGETPSDNAAAGEQMASDATQSESDEEDSAANTSQNQIAVADERRLVLDRHFVLPTRSSSRIIKPNKRLMEDLGSISIKKTSKDTNSISNNKREQTNYFGSLLSLGIKPGKETMGGTNTATTSTNAFSMNFAMNSMKLNGFVLRQPRLQFESLADRNSASAISATTQSQTSALSPPLSNVIKSGAANTNNALNSMSFGALSSATNSLLNSNSSSLTTTATCSVCTTPIPSKSLQQSRKYGAVACEACCKFIVKMRKSSQPLQCKGDGNDICNIHLSLKGYLKNFKKLYKERCSACWLRKCLLELQFPPEYKCRLSSLLQAASATKASTSSVKKSESRLPETALKVERPAVELTSPSSGMCFANSSSSNSVSEPSTSAQIKWKSKLESNTALANVDSVKLLNTLKSNPLSENNATFGSTPLLLRPAILENSLFLNKREDKTDAMDTTAEPPFVEDQTQLTKQGKSSRRGGKHDHKEKATKDTDTVLNVKTTTAATLDESDETPQDRESLSPTTAGAITDNCAQSPTATAAAYSAATPPSVLSNNSNTTTGIGIISTSITATATVEVAATSANGGDSLKRQRIDLKGPRVKHVCRSASIVLGQPLATFGEGEEQTDESEFVNNGEVATGLKSPTSALKPTSPPQQERPQEITDNSTKLHTKPQMLTDENDNCAGCKQSSPSPATSKTSQEGSAVTQTKPLDGKKGPQLPQQLATAAAATTKTSTRHITSSTTVAASSNVAKKYMRLSSEQSAYATTTSASAQQQSMVSSKRSAKDVTKSKTLISIDFWENYDPAEVCQSGFGLIITETVAQRALCFLCGATGLEPLMFCACCCEPYHQYCVLDEYNLKHYTSFDDTTIVNSSILDSSTATTTTTTALLLNSSNGINQISNRLNWLCPRCTVCYTCNMSSGSKVRCQKCQKNYHTTCLGTSKRLLGADRPLICVNCLKCKSCATTKVSKFVGNLPMCTQCFKLRKKGNYCPICQKCYDDNDFDLKMMECGECNRWVHAKCEGLSDEQYNLLSTLPESIEFICKKCARRNESAKQKAQEWRHAVMEEFRASLLSVLKLLSKSRQACALLKLSPRKKVRCTCGNGKIQPKALQFSMDEHSQLGSDGESQNSDDIYEFKDQPMQTPTITITGKPKSKCCACLQSYNSNCSGGSFLSLVDIKQKISSNSYVSLAEFNYDMNNVIHQSNCDELIIAYKELLSEQFPWFQNETKACTDALEEDMFESCGGGYNQHNNSIMDDSPADYAAIETDNAQAGIADGVLEIPVDVDDIVCHALKSRMDTRVCLFCRKTGEGLPNEEARLLYCGHDCWVHTNCAMWSAEVFEEIDGSLQNVHSAVSRGRMIKCTVCGNRGATVGCNVKSCGEHYHYPCARSIPECAFLTDKSMYCPAHAKNAIFATGVTHETNFEVSRPVYVELDRKRKKLIEPAKVQFHIGSLEVKQLGAIVPRFSDSFEALVPINFLCSRLYWSLKEPWKLVEYTVRTTIQNSYSTLTTMDSGRNITVDHSNPNSSLVQLGLAQIALWHNSLARGELMDIEWSGNAATEMATLSKFFPEYISQNSCSVVPDENTEEEPQNNGDLLPPEIKDAIFEDLPHELLDGISMLDIFMYEDLGDAKTEMFALSEQSKDGINNAAANTQTNASTSSAHTATSNMHISDEDTANSSGFGKQLELSNSWPTGNLTVNHVEDAMLSAARTNQAKHRGASKTGTTGLANDLLIKKPSQGAQTRSWPKLDSNSMAAIKRRKLSKGLTEGMLLSLNHQQQRSKASKETASVAGISRRQSICTGELAESGAIRSKTFTWSAAKRYIDVSKDDLKDEQMTSKIKIMQMDGVDDSITTEFRIITSDVTQSTSGNGQFSGQVRCERCQCTYRNFESFQRHLANCEPMSTSESESETTNGISNEQQHHITATTATLTAETLNELQKQAAAAATLTTTNTNGMPFLQATFPQVQNLSTIGGLQGQLNGIPLANLQGLQGVQDLQGLQNLQLQQLQPQPLGGGFFISQTNPTQTTATANDELQLYANSLQSLANLNGGFTLTQPAVTTSQAASQPQFIALSTNPDGTQQFIQLPQSSNNATAQLLQVAANNNAATAAAYQTLQATNSNKKIVLPVTGKPLKTVATKAAQQATAAAKQRQLKAASNVKPIQAKLVAPATNGNIAQTQLQQQHQHQQQTPITLLSSTAANNNAATQLLSQQLLQPQLLFQTANAAAAPAGPSLIMQQPQTQNIISFVTSDASQNPHQLQYVTIPTSSDFKTPQPTPTFLTTTAGAHTSNANSLLQGAATFLQTDASGNLMLTTTQTPSGLQMLATPLQAAQPQLIGTLIQPQTLQLGGNVQLTTAGADATQSNATGSQTQQPIIIGGGATATSTATGLEFTTAAPQVILATQPMYYGLETIVQNTVMSSQQFVSTAMPGVLSQNASFSATTTQVFQASKIEPIVDIPASYVVLNNATVDAAAGANAAFLNATNAAVLQPQATAALDDATQQLFRLQTATGDQNAHAANNNYQFQPQQQHPAESLLVTAKVPPQVAQAKRPGAQAKATSVAAVTNKVQPQPQQVVNKVLPTSIAQQQTKPVGIMSSKQTAAQYQRQMLDGKTKPTLTASGAPPSIASKPLQNRKTNLIRPMHKVEVKPKIMKSLPNNVKAANVQQQHHPLQQQQQQQQHQQQQQQQQQQHHHQQQQQTSMLANKQLGATTALGITYNGAAFLSTQPKMQPPVAVQQQRPQQQQPQQQQPQQQQQQQQQIQFPLIAATIAPAQPTAASSPFILTTNNIINVLEPVHQQQQQQQHQQQQQQQQQLTYQNNNNIHFTNTNNNEITIPTTTTTTTISDSSVCNISNRLLQQYQTANNLPTNIVNPLQLQQQQQQQQQHNLTVTTAATVATTSQAMTINTRPTNRVLPMQQRQESPPHTTTVVSSTQSAAQATLAAKSIAMIQQQLPTTTTAEISTKGYGQIEPKGALYEADVKSLQMMANGNFNSSPIITVAAAAPILQQRQHQQEQQQEHQHQQQHEATNMHIYEKQLCQAKNPGDYMLLDGGSCEQQIDMSHCLLNKDSYEVNSNHIGNVEIHADCMDNELLKQDMNDVACTNGDAGEDNDDDAIVDDDGEEEEEDEADDDNDDDDDDDDFSLKMPTPDGEEHEVSDGEEPAVKEKISKILDNLTNDDCADSIATATTVEATAVAVAAELQNDAGYQQMVEDVLAETATANAGNADECDALDATDMANFTATAEETAAVAAAATAYITEMAKAHELQQYKRQLEVDLAKPPAIVDNRDADNEANLMSTAEAVTETMAAATVAPSQQPPYAREVKKISGPHLLYEIQSEDGFTYKSTSITEIWEKVFEAVQVARRAHGLTPLPEGPLADMSGVQMIGLKTNALKYLIEQLPGVEKCSKYTPKYHKRNTPNAAVVSAIGNAALGGCTGSNAMANSNAMSGNSVCASDLSGTLLDYSSDQDELLENPYECARVEPYSNRSEYDMFSWLASRHRKQPIQVFVQPSDTEMVPRRGTGSNLPMAMKYRTLKETYKDYVGVFRSHIHGRGLYCTKDIEAGEMVIEYAGELIRSTLTDKRERYYDSRGIGCYMFKIDDNLVVDATMRGNAARFINHSCEPNCYSKVVDILGHKHIIIFALRRIVQGEELTYDYKFPFEDEKIPCSCGSKKCRKYLN